jgi:hypothetical protein
MDTISFLKGKTTLDTEISNLLHRLRYKDNRLFLVGSSSILQIEYFGDYDCITTMSKEDDAKEAYKEFIDILKRIMKENLYYFIELKLQTLKGEKHKYFPDDKFDFETFNKVYNDLEYLKIDLVIWAETNQEFIETSIIYIKDSDKKLEKEDFIKSLKSDVKEFQEQNKYFKTLKRKFLIYNLNGKTDKMKDLIKIFNSPLGKAYKIKSNLEALSLIKKYYFNDPIVRKRYDLNLKALKLPENIDIEKEREKIDKMINSKAKILNEKFKI